MRSLYSRLRNDDAPLPRSWTPSHTPIRRRVVVLSVSLLALLVGVSAASPNTTPTPTTSTPSQTPTPSPTAGESCGAGCFASQRCRTPFNGFIVDGVCLPNEGCRCYFEGAVCGNGVKEGDEECDDGGICMGGTNAGTPCTSESQCQGSGVCVGGTRAESACVSDSACPGGQCIHCRTFGGDGCAANCTIEHDSTIDVVSGALDGEMRLLGTSGMIIHGDILTIPLPLDGALTLTTGKPRLGQIPIVVRAGAVRFSGIPIGALGCGCVRGIARKTCGGTFFDADGSPSLDCTPGLTAGDGVCAGRKPCAALHGDGNAMSGVIGCSGLDLVDYRLTQDAGSTGIPSAPQLTFSGSGGPGSAVIFGTTAIATILGACTGCEPGYGPDCEFCTADDPPSSVGVPTTAPFTTGTATAEVLNANATSGLSIGPFSVVGSPLDCVSLLNGGSSGGTIVAVATTLGLPTLGDIALTAQIAFQPGALNTPTPTPIPPLCIGDCNRDGTVTVDELITGVNMALGTIPSAARRGPWCT